MRGLQNQFWRPQHSSAKTNARCELNGSSDECRHGEINAKTECAPQCHATTGRQASRAAERGTVPVPLRETQGLLRGKKFGVAPAQALHPCAGMVPMCSDGMATADSRCRQ